MENAKFEMLRSVKPVEEEDIIKSVLEHGIKETAFSLKLEQCDLIYKVSIYISKMKCRIRNLETWMSNESLQEDSDVKKIMVVDVEKIEENTHEELTLAKKEEGELESNKTSDEEFSCTKNEDKEEKEDGELEEDSDGSYVKKISMEKIVVNTHEELTSIEKEEGELESSKTSDKESTCTENEDKEDEEGGLESSMVSVEESSSSDKEKTVVTSRSVVSLAEIMLQQAMSTKENESNLKTLTEKEKGGFSTTGSEVGATKQMVGRGYGRGSVFARNCVQGGFGRGHYVRTLQQQQQSHVIKEDTSSSDNQVQAVHGGLSMYMENARIMRTRKHKR